VSGVIIDIDAIRAGKEKVSIYLCSGCKSFSSLLILSCWFHMEGRFQLGGKYPREW